MLNEPDPSYHGVVYTEALGAAAYIGRCRVVPLRNTGAALSPAQRLPAPAGPRNAGPAHGAPLRERPEGGRAPAGAPQGGLGQLRRACRTAPTTRPARRSPRARPRASSASASRAAREAGAQFIDALQMILRLVNIGDAKSLACHPASTTHRQLEPGGTGDGRRVRGPGAHLGRHRAHRRHHRRHRPGAGCGNGLRPRGAWFGARAGHVLFV